MAKTTYLVTGASRGLGLEFVRQLVQKQRDAFVVAAARNPSKSSELVDLTARSGGRIVPLRLDLTDSASFPAFAKEVEEVTRMAGAPDVLIQNAGVYGQGSLLDLPPSALQAEFQTNLFGPVALFQALHPLMRSAPEDERRGPKKVIHISSGYGSITGGHHEMKPAYSLTKAALNMYTRKLSADLRSRYGEQAWIVLSLDPGWVQTDMGGPEAPLKKEQAIEGMLKVIESATAKDSGRFISWQGRDVRW